MTIMRRCPVPRGRAGRWASANLLALALLAVLCAMLVPARAGDTPKAALVGPVLRTTIVVRDLDAAMTLFRDVLGLHVVTDLDLQGEQVNELLGVQDQRMRIVIFDTDGSPTGRVAVLSYSSPAPPEVPRQAARVEVGDVVLVMSTPDVDAAYQRVRDAGYRIVSPPRVIFQRPDMVVQSREMVFVGPEGVAINLLQRGVPATSAK